MLSRARIEVVVVAILAATVYVNTLGHGFVFDDVQNILQNRWITDTRFLADIFTHHAAGFDTGLSTSYYRPVMHLVGMVNYHAFGFSPGGFHAVNVALHALTSVLALLVARRAWKDLSPCREVDAGGNGPVTAAMVFAVHPVHTEAVSWLAGVTDLTYTLCALVAFLLSATATRAFEWRNWMAAAAFFVAALSKEPALTLPIVLLAFELLRPGSATRLSTTMLKLVPFAIAGLAYFCLRLYALGGFAPSLSTRLAAGGDPFASACALLGSYLGLLAWPATLNALHAYAPTFSISDPRALVGAAAILALVGVALWLCRRAPIVTFALLLAVVPLLPVLYIPALGEGVFAERYLYLPVLERFSQLCSNRIPGVAHVVGALR